MKKNKYILLCLALSVLFSESAFAQMKKVAQSGMTYLSISLGARESGIGNAATASVKGAQALFYNPGRITKVEGFNAIFNQVNWLAETKIYGIGMVYNMGMYGAIGLDVIYMDYGDIMGTVRDDTNPLGFKLTGNLSIQDYAIGLSYAYQVNDRFSFGGKVKYAYEDLGRASYAYTTVYDPEVKDDVLLFKEQNWDLGHLGFDFGASYDIGYKDMAFAVAFCNYSTDMKYYSEVFQMPLTIRMGLAMDIAKALMPDQKEIVINTSIDAVSPIDYTNRVHLGSELIYKEKIALRTGYKFNYDVENFSFGLGLLFDYSSYEARLDYAYTNAEYFGGVNRFSLGIGF